MLVNFFFLFFFFFFNMNNIMVFLLIFLMVLLSIKNIFVSNIFCLNLGYYLSMDFFSFFFILFTLLLFFTIIMMKHKTNMKMLVSALIMMILLVFTTVNLLYFIMFFESVSLMIFFFLKYYSYYKERNISFFYLFLFNYISSIPFFIMVMFMSNFFIYNFSNMHMFLNCYFYFFLFIMIFTTKLPMYFFHMWLPKAHVDSPTVGSMLLASVLLKMSAFSLCRYFMVVSNNLFLFLMNLSFMSYLFTSLLSMRVLDMKTCIAYSSIYHMNFALIGLVTYSMLSSYYIFLGHAFISPIMFFLVGLIYEHSYSRNLVLLNSLFKINMVFFYMFFLTILLNLGLPPFLNFYGEVLVFMGLYMFMGMGVFFFFFGFIMSSYFNIRLYILMTSSKKINFFKKNFFNNFFLVFLLIIIYMIFSFFFLPQ